MVYVGNEGVNAGRKFSQIRKVENGYEKIKR